VRTTFFSHARYFHDDDEPETSKERARLTPNLAPSRTGATQVLSLSTASDASMASSLAVLASRLPWPSPTPRPSASSSSACTTTDFVSPTSTRSSPPRAARRDKERRQRRSPRRSEGGCKGGGASVRRGGTKGRRADPSSSRPRSHKTRGERCRKPRV
jgi:hypothetical protein